MALNHLITDDTLIQHSINRVVDGISENIAFDIDYTDSAKTKDGVTVKQYTLSHDGRTIGFIQFDHDTDSTEPQLYINYMENSTRHTDAMGNLVRDYVGVGRVLHEIAFRHSVANGMEGRVKLNEAYGAVAFHYANGFRKVNTSLVWHLAAEFQLEGAIKEYIENYELDPSEDNFFELIDHEQFLQLLENNGILTPEEKSHYFNDEGRVIEDAFYGGDDDDKPKYEILNNFLERLAAVAKKPLDYRVFEKLDFLELVKAYKKANDAEKEHLFEKIQQSPTFKNALTRAERHIRNNSLGRLEKIGLKDFYEAFANDEKSLEDLPQAVLEAMPEYVEERVDIGEGAVGNMHLPAETIQEKMAMFGLTSPQLQEQTQEEEGRTFKG